MRKIIIAGNWKMNKTLEETTDFFQQISTWENGFSHNCEIVIFPSYIYIPSALKILKNNEIIIGAQNVYFKKFGAFTAEISPQMLSSLGCKCSIVGHSERRHIFGESDDLISKKVKALIENEQKVVLCIGETENQRENEETEKVLRNQLDIGLKNISSNEMSQVALAYEPVWAIGTGKTATPEIAEKAHKFIRKWLQENFGKKVALETSILYGGSVKVHNIKELIHEEDIDGALIGGASLKMKDFTKIISITENVCYS